MHRHPHPPTPRVARHPLSLLAQGAGARLGCAALGLLLLWGAVFWALH